MNTIRRGTMQLGNMRLPAIEIRKFDESAPECVDPRMAYAYLDRGDKQLRYDWNQNFDMEQGYGHLTDVEVAAAVRMLMRDDMNHEMICTMSRDRIMALSKEVARLNAVISTMEKRGE